MKHHRNNLIETSFLDISFNFATEKYFTFRKANHQKVVYIDQQENFCNKEDFDKVKPVYETAGKDSGHFSSISFNDSNTPNP